MSFVADQMGTIEDGIREAVAEKASQEPQRPAAPVTSSAIPNDASIFTHTVETLEHYCDRMDAVLQRIGRHRAVLDDLSNLLHGRTFG